MSKGGRQCKGSIVSLDRIAPVKNVTVCSLNVMDCDEDEDGNFHIMV